LRFSRHSESAGPATGDTPGWAAGDCPFGRNPFDQVLVQVSDKCRYDELMRVVEACTKQKLPDSKALPKLSFVELPSG